MGDMKTPDFDDLLAAFDIPDATGLDAKESIQGSHEAESQLKHAGMCLEDSLLSSQAVIPADIPVVSVIVKNTIRQESLESFSDRLHSGPPVQNGYRGQEASTDSANTTDSGFSKLFVSALNGESSRELPGEAPIQHKPDATPIFSQSVSHFSPVSSPECEKTQCNLNEMQPNQGRPCFPDASGLFEASVADNPNQMDLSMFDSCSKDTQGSRGESTSGICVGNKTEKTLSVQSEIPASSRNPNFSDTTCESGTTMNATSSYSHAKSQTSKFSSCLEALVALNARKDPTEPANSREPSALQNDGMKASPKVPISPQSPRSPLETVKRLMKPADSPVSIYSDSSGKASPAVMSGSPLVIPRVRIKTIKTTSGRIKRTATSVVPDSETDEVHSAYESSPSQSVISEDSYWTVSPHRSQTVDNNVGIQNKGIPTSRSSPKVLPRKLQESSRRSGATLPPTVLQNAGGSVKRTVSNRVQKPKRVSASKGHSTSTNFLPKAIHLASLNLVPHSVAASVTARPTSHQPSQHTLSSTVYSTVPLVHQVKTASPCHNTSVQNTSAGTLNRLLHQTNPVPAYVPNLTPPPESNISLPPHGYCCLECGDSFAVERSLAFHYKRRSVHIEVRCAHCAKTIVFFNKCALWAHAREHKNSGVMMQCTHLRMNPISEKEMFVPMSTDPVKVGSFTTPLPVPPPLPPQNEPVLPLYQDSVNRHPRSCLECGQQSSDNKGLAGHFQRLSGDVEKLICKVCSMLLPNKCSFKAHQRLHTHKSPYCCPECGAASRSADLQKHVKENCLHYARKAWYKCLHCDTVFKTLQSQKNHVEEKHCETVHKCNNCTAVFKTFDTCEQHMKSRHKDTTVSPKLVLRCSCGTVFKKKQLLLEHFNQSVYKRLSCVFKCPECNSVFSQKQQLMQHFKGVHVGNTATEREKSSEETDTTDCDKDLHPIKQQKSHSHVKRTESPRKKLEHRTGPHVKLTCWMCGECLQSFPDRDSFVAHMKANHRKSVKKFLCRYCEKTFKSSTSMKRHIRTEHTGDKRTYTCWYCTDSKKAFTTSVMLKNHISLMHGIKNPDLNQMPKTSLRECEKAFGKGSKTEAAMSTQVEKQDHAGDLEASSSKRLKTQFRCSKCGFVTDDSSQFQLHIPQHKTDENTPQCLHCGLCFTSVLSLNRHLFIVHKVKDPKEEVAKEQRVRVREQAQDNQLVRSAEADGVNNASLALSELESSCEETESPHPTRSTDCNLTLRC